MPSLDLPPAGTPAPSPMRPARPAGPPLSYVPSLTPHLFVPSAERPVRAKVRALDKHTQVLPHHHPWAQVVTSAGGVIRVNLPQATYIVPPNRALWIPAGLEHAVTMVESARMHTLYFHQPAGRCGPAAAWVDAPGWQQCRVLEASPLLRALVRELSTVDDLGPPLSPAALRREHHLSALVCDELQRAQVMRLGIALPRDKRLQHLCEAVLAQPTLHETLEAWAQDTGASPRTVARLFRRELGCTFTQWRLQVILAQAVALAARPLPIAQIAAELGYGPSAFSAMVRRTVGLSPSDFLGQHPLEAQPG